MLAEALDVQTVWQKVPDFKMGDISLTDFTAALNAADVVSKEHAKNRVDRTGLKVNRDNKFRCSGTRVAKTGTGGFHFRQFPLFSIFDFKCILDDAVC